MRAQSLKQSLNRICARQAHSKTGAALRIIGSLYAATMRLGDGPDDCQAEPRTRIGRGIPGPVEAVEQHGDFFRGNANAGVRNRQAEGTRLLTQMDCDPAAGGCKF